MSVCVCVCVCCCCVKGREGTSSVCGITYVHISTRSAHVKVRSIHRDGRQGAHRLTQCGRREQREAQDRIRHHDGCECVKRRRVEEINDEKTTVDFSDSILPKYTTRNT